MLPITHLVLYKHGICVVTRRGRVAGAELALQFTASDIDDALKSLTIVPLDGGQVAGVRYATPHTARDDTPGGLELDQDHSLFDLIRNLRGARVSLQLEGSNAVQGRVVGAEEHPQGREFGATLLVLTEDGTVRQLATDRVIQLYIEDGRMAGDLAGFLDRVRSDDPRRELLVTLTESDREVEVSYAIPSPVWRVSYRFVGQTGDGEPTGLLQGWGIFDNHLGEDLIEVAVALVAGQPVSFQYDLTSSVIPPRPTVQDEARVASAPVEFESRTWKQSEVAAGATALSPRDEDQYDVPAFVRPRAPRAVGAAHLSFSTHVQAESRELDELFEYRIPSVSAGRDESAMAPIAQYTSGYRRELLYNGEKHPRHPVVGIRLQNGSGLTLERGPVTIYEDGDYRGEAILPFTKQGAEVVLAFAVELGITVVEEHRHEIETEGVDLAGALLHVRQYHVRTTSYTVTNATGQEQVVIVERSIWAELHDTRAPDEETAEHRRWRVTCLPGEKMVFVIGERLLQSHEERIEDQSAESMAAFLAQHGLSPEARERLGRIMELRRRVERIEFRVHELRAEQDQIGQRQERLRRNLGMQPQSDDEAELRRRSVQDFRRTQDREDAIIGEIEQLQAEHGEVERRLAEAMS